MVDTSSAAKSLKEYLKKYTSNDDSEIKKKKKKRKAKPDVSGVLVVDQDPIWQKPINLGDEDEDSPEEDRPLVDEDIEVKRMKRLELLRSKRSQGTVSEDGSGWVSVSTVSNVSGRERGRRRNDSPSPEARPRSDGLLGPDLSPPRHSRRRSPSAELEKSAASGSKGDRRAVRYDTPSPRGNSGGDEPKDLSPVRRRRRDRSTAHSIHERAPSSPKAIDSDVSAPRRAHHGTNPANSNSDDPKDLSPVRRGRRDRGTSHSAHERASSSPEAIDSDISPPRRTRPGSNPAYSTSDLSPPRKGKGSKPQVPPRRTGLVSAEDIKDEISKMKKETDARFKEMDPSASGQNAAPVYRDKITGKRMTREEFLNSQKKQLKKDDPPKEIKLEWGKGLAQKQEAEARLKELESEKNKPFARSRDDPDLDSMLKERVRWGDPMAHLVKKKYTEMSLPNLGDDEKMRESGFIIPQEIPAHSWIRRGLPAAPNRYGIKPGRHWDGVDRSNGHEKEMFIRVNERRATEQEAYLWSVADM